MEQSLPITLMWQEDQERHALTWNGGPYHAIIEHDGPDGWIATVEMRGGFDIVEENFTCTSLEEAQTAVLWRLPLSRQWMREQAMEWSAGHRRYSLQHRNGTAEVFRTNGRWTARIETTSHDAMQAEFLQLDRAQQWAVNELVKMQY